MSGLGGGWLTWAAITGVLMFGLAFIISLVVGKVTRGFAQIAVSTALSLFILLVLAASGMAKSDFTIWFVVPYAALAVFMAAIWYLVLKMKAANG